MKKSAVSTLKADGSPSYWVRAVLFEQGALSISLPQSYSLASLMKISSEVSNTTHIDFSEWCTISRKCLGINGDTATVLFNAFETLCNTDPTSLLQMTRDELCAIENGVVDAYKATRKVPLSKFLIFLFIQLYHRNTSLLSPRHDVWPHENNTNASTTMQSMLSPTRAMALSSRVTDQEDQVQFVKRHLYDMLVLVALGKYKVSLSQIQVFEMLFHEGEDHMKEVPFGSLMPFWQKSKDAILDRSHLVDISVLQTFVSQRLAPNRAMYPPVELPTKDTTPKLAWQPDSNACVYSVSGVTKTLHVKTAQDTNPQIKLVRIFCNHQANIYLLMPLQHVAIFGCTNCTIILGTVSQMVTITHCEKVRVVCAARFVRINHSLDVRMYGCLNTKPMIGGGNKNIELAPYNIHYPTLEHHLQVSGLNPRLNYWDSPICLSKEKCVGPLPAPLFSSISIPFHILGSTVCNPCPLPPDYTKELENKTLTASDLCDQIRKMSESGSEGYKVIQHHFREWLVNSGNLRHVLDLLQHDEQDV
uniref:C-CAP/cofactor C-like domain-containing protein n=1 Tax=Eutreptiella gymnastica TaxID=73025 RepID=A0A7S1J4U4_9EUGL|mmetsp:Transcript_67358/g.119426  ORF Transcript_67358/g.119426 Transcript_67358/m.119426 type:complete len:531 (+) Transcript_67358:89-1681(+)